jgi:XRE family transcriptional regulator, regulator of sulfur utilization
MVTGLNKAAANIASNLTSIRSAKGLSQAKLAEVSGVTRASIALLETGSSNPTLEILMKLSSALQVSIDELISSPRAECRLIRSKDVPVDRRSRNGVLLRKLLPDQIPATELDELVLEPGGILTGSPHIQGTREYFTCLRGEVLIFTCLRGEILIGVLGETYQLEKGDVLSFPGDKPHSYKNIGRGTAHGISVVLFASEFAPAFASEFAKRS